MTSDKKRVGLALSGGGYRASAFHLGTLNKLNEMGILDKVDVVSTISGGSITGAALCLHQGDYPSFHQKMVNDLKTKNVVRYVLKSGAFLFPALLTLVFLIGVIMLSFTRWSGLSFFLLAAFLIVLFKNQFNILPISKIIEDAYNKFFYNGQTLNDLRLNPVLAIGSSNLHTGRPFTFSRSKMSDSNYAYWPEGAIEFNQEQFPVARAVMASSCVPFAFTPIHITKEFFKDTGNFTKVKPVLVDGGVYDNQGIQKLTQPGSSYECDVIITSDAGGNFVDDKTYNNTFTLLMRTVDLFMYRIKTTQMVQNIYRNVDGAAKPIAYFSLGWEIDKTISGFYNNMCAGKVLPEVIKAHEFQPQLIDNPKNFKQQIIEHLQNRVGYTSILQRNLKPEQWQLARTTGTSLTNLSAERIGYLIRHAENMTELQIKLYCPNLIQSYGS